MQGTARRIPCSLMTTVTKASAALGFCLHFLLDTSAMDSEMPHVMTFFTRSK